MNRGERVKALREKRKLGIRELSRELKVSPQSVHNAENDDISINEKMIIKLCVYFRISADHLLFGEKDEGN